MRAETRLAVGSEHLLAEIVERALQVTKGDALIDDQALDLVKLRQMRGVGNVAAVHLARGDHVDGRFLLLHGMHLHAGGLRAQKHVGFAAHGRRLTGQVAHVEGILHGTGRMVLRGV